MPPDAARIFRSAVGPALEAATFAAAAGTAEDVAAPGPSRDREQLLVRLLLHISAAPSRAKTSPGPDVLVPSPGGPDEELTASPVVLVAAGTLSAEELPGPMRAGDAAPGLRVSGLLHGFRDVRDPCPACGSRGSFWQALRGSLTGPRSCQGGGLQKSGFASAQCHDCCSTWGPTFTLARAVSHGRGGREGVQVPLLTVRECLARISAGQLDKGADLLEEDPDVYWCLHAFFGLRIELFRRDEGGSPVRLGCATFEALCKAYSQYLRRERRAASRRRSSEATSLHALDPVSPRADGGPAGAPGEATESAAAEPAAAAEGAPETHGPASPAEVGQPPPASEAGGWEGLHRLEEASAAAAKGAAHEWEGAQEAGTPSRPGDGSAMGTDAVADAAPPIPPPPASNAEGSAAAAAQWKAMATRLHGRDRTPDSASGHRTPPVAAEIAAGPAAHPARRSSPSPRGVSEWLEKRRAGAARAAGPSQPPWEKRRPRLSLQVLLSRAPPHVAPAHTSSWSGRSTTPPRPMSARRQPYTPPAAAALYDEAYDAAAGMAAPSAPSTSPAMPRSPGPDAPNTGGPQGPCHPGGDALGVAAPGRQASVSPARALAYVTLAEAPGYESTCDSAEAGAARLCPSPIRVVPPGSFSCQLGPNEGYGLAFRQQRRRNRELATGGWWETPGSGAYASMHGQWDGTARRQLAPSRGSDLPRRSPSSPRDAELLLRCEIDRLTEEIEGVRRGLVSAPRGSEAGAGPSRAAQRPRASEAAPASPRLPTSPRFSPGSTADHTRTGATPCAGSMPRAGSCQPRREETPRRAPGRGRRAWSPPAQGWSPAAQARARLARAPLPQEQAVRQVGGGIRYGHGPPPAAARPRATSGRPASNRGAAVYCVEEAPASCEDWRASGGREEAWAPSSTPRRARFARGAPASPAELFPATPKFG